MPGSDRPEISIIVPSHNRVGLLREVLDALAGQIAGTPAFEVIVVADGCSDGTEGVVASYAAPYPIEIVRLPGQGPSRARNAGARAARSEFLLFLDDDVIPTPGLVAAHVAALREAPGRAVLGPYPPEPVPAGDLFRLSIKRWWQAHFDNLARPGHRYTYTDVLTGNLSMARATWDAVGGLDPQFSHAREDLELGVRLLKMGAELHYAPDALGWHQEHLTASPSSALRRARHEGQSDALMAIKHPDIAAALRVARMLRRPGARRSRKISFVRKTGFLADRIVKAGPGLLEKLERLGLVKLRRRLKNALLEYCYLRGAFETLGNDWERFSAEPIHRPDHAEIEIDLAHGIDAAEQTLRERRPTSVRLVHGHREVGTMPWSPAAERWNAHHLRPFLARRAAYGTIPWLAHGKYGGEAWRWEWFEGLRRLGNLDYMAHYSEGQQQWQRPTPPVEPRPYVPDRRISTRARQAVRRILGNGICVRAQSRSRDETLTAARGWLLTFVFFIHAMIGTAEYLGPDAHATHYVLKLLVPDVSAFFFLAGMSATGMRGKRPGAILRQSLVFLLFAMVSHIGGFAILLAGHAFATPLDAVKGLVVPLITGTDTSSFVGWFFIALAMARLYAYTFLRSRLLFALFVAGTVLAIRAGQHLGIPDNVFEWRNWPTATLFFLIGTRIPDMRKLPNWAGTAALVGTVLLALINRHGLWRLGPCLTCDPLFAAQPMIGQYGSIFVYVPQQILFVVTLLWIAQRTARTAPGAVARYFGRASLPILLMHGWVLLTLYPGMLAALPHQETPFLYVAVYSCGVVVHGLLFSLFERPIHLIQRAIFKLSYLGSARRA